MKNPHLFSAQVYYEDTDHSGVVYHANYLKFFERAREDIIGVDTLSDMWHNQGVGFAVYKIAIQYHDGAVFGDKLDIFPRGLAARCCQSCCHLHAGACLPRAQQKVDAHSSSEFPGLKGRITRC